MPVGTAKPILSGVVWKFPSLHVLLYKPTTVPYHAQDVMRRGCGRKPGLSCAEEGETLGVLHGLRRFPLKPTSRLCLVHATDAEVSCTFVFAAENAANLQSSRLLEMACLRPERVSYASGQPRIAELHPRFLAMSEDQIPLMQAS